MHPPVCLWFNCQNVIFHKTFCFHGVLYLRFLLPDCHSPERTHIDSTSTGFGVIFWKLPSFNIYIIPPMDSRTSFLAGHTAASAVVGSLSLLRRPLLCIWSLKPAKTIFFGFNSVCQRTTIFVDMNCIQSRSVSAKIITSGQKRT